MVKDFIKSSFQNGNRYTNITVTIILLLLGIITFFVKDIYADFKDLKKEVNTLKVDMVRLEQQLQDHVGKNPNTKQ